jgi:hypothetical protein
MATTTQIRNLRIDISDPPDIISILAVATEADLPSDPKPQTAYYITDKEVYVTTEKTVGAISSDYITAELFLSDSKIGSLIDADGYDKALYKAVRLISSKLGSKLLIVKNQNGAEAVEYLKLLDLYKYYKGLVKDFKTDDYDKTSNDTGKIGRSSYTQISGGNL